jgi:hypothetical protein
MNNEMQHNLDYLLNNLDRVSSKFKNKDSKKYLQDILEELQYKIAKNKHASANKKEERRREHLMKRAHKSKRKSPRKSPKKRRDTPYPIVIKDVTPDILNDISDEIKQSLYNNPNKDVHLGQIKSFSPDVNQKLISLKTIEKTDIFSNCKALDKNKLVPTVWNGVKCIKFDNTAAQQVLLANLSSKTIYPVENIIAPKQIQSNCWFNCMFMTFFISDKGRKFFKFFRQLMVEGETVDGDKIPPNIWKSFALLNLAVEATLTGYHKLEMFNTNSIIQEIYSAIPSSARKEEIYRVNVAGNPTEYYRGIMRYLKGDQINILNIEPSFFDTEYTGDLPDVLCYSVLAEEAKREIYKKTEIKVKGTNYVLDSASIIDTEGRHFCCVVTYNKKEYGFDGASFKRLSPFSWKKLINATKKFTFKGSYWGGTKEPIYWDFRNGYQELYYYRV